MLKPPRPMQPEEIDALLALDARAVDDRVVIRLQPTRLVAVASV